MHVLCIACIVYCVSFLILVAELTQTVKEQQQTIQKLQTPQAVVTPPVVLTYQEYVVFRRSNPGPKSRRSYERFVDQVCEDDPAREGVAGEEPGTFVIVSFVCFTLYFRCFIGLC